MTSTILIVDDEPGGRIVLEGVLISQGYNLAFATNGPEALEQARALTPDLILLDVMMPGMDGYEVCRRLRATPRLAEVPIVLLTALIDRESRLRGLQAGADDFLSKPFDREELRARVKTITRLNRYRRLLSERMRFAWVVEPANEGYMLIDEQDEIRYANLRARLFLGLQNEQPIIERFLSLAGRQYRCEPQESWEGWPQLDAPALSRPRFLVRPESATTKALWLQVDVLTPPAEGEDNYLLRLRDITAQMTNQRELRKFHAVVQHKFRSPLIQLILSLELLAQESETLSANEVGELSASALTSAHRLHSEIEDILRYLRAPTLAHVEGGLILSQLPRMVERIADNLGLDQVALDIAPEVAQARLLLSQEAVEWLLWELLENAKKFHPSQRPQVEIALASADSGRVSLRICDDGVSLAPELLTQVWAPYYQGEKYFTGQVAGMGLGLPLVASMIWEVDGQCRLYNRDDGPGVVAELLLPVGAQA